MRMSEKDQQGNYVNRINRTINIILDDPKNKGFEFVSWGNAINIHTSFANNKHNPYYNIVLSGDWVSKDAYLATDKNAHLRSVEKRFLGILDKMNVTTVYNNESAACSVCQGLIETTDVNTYKYSEKYDTYTCVSCLEY